MTSPRSYLWGLLAAVSLFSGAAVSSAASDEPPMNVQEEIRALKAEVRRLRAKDDESWLTERRAEEVKTLIKQVLVDADTRASMAEGGMTAGHDGSHFFLASEDGTFLLELAGHFQGRYISNWRDSNSGDEHQAGFVMRRLKFKGSGHIASPKIKYAFSLAADRGRTGVLDGIDGADTNGDPDALPDDDITGDSTEIKQLEFEDYYISYDFAEAMGGTWAVRLGRWKQPFARENMVSSSRQMAMERSSVHEAFRIDRSEGVMLTYAGEMFKGYLSLNDGGKSEQTDFSEDRTDYALTARGEVLLAGAWGQFKDFSAWSKDPGLGVMLGGAVHYEAAETGMGTGANNKELRWTADLSVETGGLGVYLAGYGRHTDLAASDGRPDVDDYGFEIMAGYMVIPDTLEPFVRYEMILQDDGRAGAGPGVDNEIALVTAGFNWYHRKHNAKFTLDVVHAFDSLGDLDGNDYVGRLSDLDDGRSGGLGLAGDDGDGQTALRMQYQLVF